ncbi:DUF493 domain-containing protein [Helicobacter sp. MIT 14-3879]|uniref:HP0495 family protein n=1 Tax=Helicobacter sp. MIT 14-3879 TaxID=2040649 RepID=UPI000E1EB8D1|nr:DUF493 domain-containing protein [Helicobacter sp. MIT 14-3879]RDU60615.1 hypothetical protein CQA44_10340 [Helicobacter sp. MIT 14-3879]
MEHACNPPEVNVDVKAHIEYPCSWSYRIIGFKKEVVLSVIERVFDGKANISPVEHFSSHHKYVAINCTVQIESDSQRLTYFDSLVKQDGIIMVI